MSDLTSDAEMIEAIIRRTYDVRESGEKPAEDPLGDAFDDGVLTPDAVRSLMAKAISTGRKLGAFYGSS